MTLHPFTVASELDLTADRLHTHGPTVDQRVPVYAARGFPSMASGADRTTTRTATGPDADVQLTTVEAAAGHRHQFADDDQTWRTALLVLENRLALLHLSLTGIRPGRLFGLDEQEPARRRVGILRLGDCASATAAAIRALPKWARSAPPGRLGADLHATWKACGPVVQLVDKTMHHADPASADERRPRRSGSGPCHACTKDVPGTHDNRLRSGWCNACRMAFERWTVESGVRDRAAFERHRLAESQPDELLRVDPTLYGKRETA